MEFQNLQSRRLRNSSHNPTSQKNHKRYVLETRVMAQIRSQNLMIYIVTNSARFKSGKGARGLVVCITQLIRTGLLQSRE